MDAGTRKDEAGEKQPDGVQARHGPADRAGERTSPEKVRLQVPERGSTQPNHEPNRVPHRQPIHFKGYAEKKRPDENGPGTVPELEVLSRQCK